MNDVGSRKVPYPLMQYYFSTCPKKTTVHFRPYSVQPESERSIAPAECETDVLPLYLDDSMWRQQTRQILRTHPVRINVFNTDNNNKSRVTFHAINDVAMRKDHTSANASKNMLYPMSDFRF
jgi:hypothetical protein